MYPEFTYRRAAGSEPCLRQQVPESLPLEDDSQCSTNQIGCDNSKQDDPGVSETPIWKDATIKGKAGEYTCQKMVVVEGSGCSNVHGKFGEASGQIEEE